MKWDIENIKLKRNKDGANSRKAKIVDAIATTPAALVVGGAAGSVGGTLIADTINFGPTKPASKSTMKMLNKAKAHHDLRAKSFSGKSAVIQAMKDKIPRSRGYAAQSFDKKLYDKVFKKFRNNSTLKQRDFIKGYRRSIKNSRIVVPSGNKAVLMHELGHIKQFHSPARLLTHATLTRVVRPGGAAAAIALMANEDTAKYAPIVAPAAIYAGELSLEGGASMFAAKETARQKGVKEGVRTALKLVKPFSTYAMKPVGMAAALYGLKRHLYGTKKKDK